MGREAHRFIIRNGLRWLALMRWCVRQGYYPSAETQGERARCGYRMQAVLSSAGMTEFDGSDACFQQATLVLNQHYEAKKAERNTLA